MTYDELFSLAEVASEKALEKVSLRIQELLKQTIQESIYNAPISKWYERTGEFKEAWDLSNIVSASKIITKELYYNSSKLSRKGNGGYTHGTPEGDDTRDILANVLNNSDLNKTYSAWGGAIGVRNGGKDGYWDIFINKLEKVWFKWMKEEFKAQGLDII